MRARGDGEPHPPQSLRSFVGAAGACFSSSGQLWGISGTSLKNGGVSNCSCLPEFCQRSQNSSHSDFQSAVFVRQAAKGGKILAGRSSKKHHRFILWCRKYPTTVRKKKNRPPPPQRKGRDWGGCGSPDLGKQVDKEEM